MTKNLSINHTIWKQTWSVQTNRTYEKFLEHLLVGMADAGYELGEGCQELVRGQLGAVTID